MTEPGFEVARVDELARIPVAQGLEWRPIARRFGIRAFGMNAYTAEKPGDWVVEEHNELSGHEEVYVVIAGRATFTVGGEEIDAPAGTIVFVRDHTLKRVARSEEEGTTVLAVGGWPDKPFEPSSWEWFFEAYSQAPEEGIATMEDGLVGSASGASSSTTSPAWRRRPGARKTPPRTWRARSSFARSCASKPPRTTTSAVSRQSDPVREPAELRHRVELRPRDDKQRAVLLAHQRGDEHVQADRERERLVGAVASERDQLLRRREAREHVAVRDARPSTRRRRAAVRPSSGRRSRAGSSRRAAGRRRATRAGAARWSSAQRRDLPRPAAAPSSRATRSGSSVTLRRRARGLAAPPAARRRSPQASGSRLRRSRPSARSRARRERASAVRRDRGPGAARSSRDARPRGLSCRDGRRRRSARRGSSRPPSRTRFGVTARSRAPRAKFSHNPYALNVSLLTKEGSTARSIGRRGSHHSAGALAGGERSGR